MEPPPRPAVPSAPLPDLVSPSALQQTQIVKIDVEAAEPEVIASLESVVDELADDVVR